MKKFSKKWLTIQRGHHVSARATNAFWDAAIEMIPQIVEMQKKENICKRIPKFIQHRRKLHMEYCPKVMMEFAFMNKHDQSIETVLSQSTPLKKYQNNSDYIKLYEKSYIKVYIYIYLIITFFVNECISNVIFSCSFKSQYFVLIQPSIYVTCIMTIK